MSKHLQSSEALSRLGRLAAPVVFAAVFALSPTVVWATAQVRFSFFINTPGECITILGPASTAISVVWKDGAGNLKAQGSGETSPGGNWFFCPGENSGLAIEVNDRIRATVPGYTRSFVVPNFTFHVDRVANMFNGMAPAGRTVKLEYTTGPLDDFAQNHSVRVATDGTWSFSPHFDVIGGLGGVALLATTNGDKLFVEGHAPVVNVTLGKSTVTGRAEQYAAASVSIQDGHDAVAETTAAIDGVFSAVFRHNGSPVAVSAGDHLSASIASDADWIVPNITGSANTTSDVVTGRCFDAGTSEGFFEVEVFRTGHIRGYLYGLVDDVAGNLTADFSDPNGSPGYEPANIKSGDRISIKCFQTTGDSVRLKFKVP